MSELRRLDLTERDIELIEVALQSAISACVGIGSSADGTNELAEEYQAALNRVRRGGD